ncbi:probable glycosyltransferase At3g07620 isoform X3 [Nymphaea colorata]|nr:probable glycosyltransferase At3g07620 isoform X3 [Nymphaea colorata]
MGISNWIRKKVRIRRKTSVVFGVMVFLVLELQFYTFPYLSELSSSLSITNNPLPKKMGTKFDSMGFLEVSPPDNFTKLAEAVGDVGLFESSSRLFSLGDQGEVSNILSVKRDFEMPDNAKEMLRGRHKKAALPLATHVNAKMVGTPTENPLMVPRKMPTLGAEATALAAKRKRSYPSQRTSVSSTGNFAGISRFLTGKDQTGKKRSGNSNTKPVRISPLEKELLSAKREIYRAPHLENVRELYAPLFRNISMFKRSYELMEKIFKVYVYKDGGSPIFHKPYLRGIYASEGWFMKLMETSKYFSANDPSRAHMFYLPYSALKLRSATNATGATRQKFLALYLKNYISMLAAKYPFWNKTHGADHFLVACHDWGPQQTRLHEEVKLNTIKALCNANPSKGIFKLGRDVSLPTTYIRSGQDPLKDVGGKPAHERQTLAFFAGQMHGRVRPVMLQHWEQDTDMKIQGEMPDRIQSKGSYRENMKSSRYCICPRGYEVNSPRVVEAIYYECVPVIISDDYVLPFDEVLNWDAFAVTVREKDIPRLKEILLSIPDHRYRMLQLGVRRVQKHFLWHANPVKYDIFHMILHSVWFSRLRQIRI